MSVKRRLGVGVGVSCFFIYFIFFCDLFGNRFLLVEKGIVTVLEKYHYLVLSPFDLFCATFDFPNEILFFYLFCFIFDFPDESLIFKMCPFDFSKEFLISKKYLRLISQPVSVRRRLRTADCGPGVKCRLRGVQIRCDTGTTACKIWNQNVKPLSVKGPLIFQYLPTRLSNRTCNKSDFSLLLLVFMGIWTQLTSKLWDFLAYQDCILPPCS